MTKRQVFHALLQGQAPPYVPWDIGFTQNARDKLIKHFGTRDLEARLDHHSLWFWPGWSWTELDPARTRDPFGVVWNRGLEKDIGNVEGCVLPRPTLRDYHFPDHADACVCRDIAGRIADKPDRFRVFAIGFSLYERAWTLRGMENLMMDFIDNPGFVHELLGAIADHNIATVKQALRYDIDAVYYGDDWGQQHGLQMGPALWREFIYPQLKRMYAVVRDAGKYVFIHSCGDVDELFDDLVGIGLNCFNPFQPEVMDVDALMRRYRGKLTFHGGMSTQRTLPYGTPADVRRETRHLLDLGRQGNYIFAPAHAVPGDVPLENMLAFIEELQNQPGWRRGR